MRRTRSARLSGLIGMALFLFFGETHAGPTEIILEKLETGLYVPSHTRGDREFGGNGPRVAVSVELKVSADGKKLLAVVNMTAKETQSDWTTASGSTTKILFQTTGSQRITGIGAPQ